MATLVKFLVHEDVGFHDIFAYFPQLNYNKRVHGNNMKVSYSTIGQHSACLKDYANESKRATPQQYAALKTELEQLGYNLKICQ